MVVYGFSSLYALHGGDDELVAGVCARWWRSLLAIVKGDCGMIADGSGRWMTPLKLPWPLILPTIPRDAIDNPFSSAASTFLRYGSTLASKVIGFAKVLVGSFLLGNRTSLDSGIPLA